MSYQINISSFTITCNGKEVVTNSVASDETHTLHGLNPSTSYNISVAAGNSGNKGKWSDWIVANTTGKIEDKGDIMVTKTDSTSATLLHSLGNDVYYRCNTTGTSTDQFNITADDGYNFSGLSADTTYTVNCVAYKDDMKYCYEANTTFKTLPGRVSKVQLQNMGMVTMDGQNRTVQQTISWEKPKNHSSTLNYTIKYGRASRVSRPDDSSAKATTAPGSNTMATLSLLLPTSTGNKVIYKVWVAARSSAGLGEYSEQLNIRYTAPTEPKDVTVVPLSCNSVNITWKPPVNSGNLTLTQYTIQYHDPTINIITDANTTFIKVNNLIPGEMYTAQVKASNGFKDSGLSVTVAATNTTQMRDTTIYIQVQATSSTSVQVTRTNGDEQYKCILNNSRRTVVPLTTSNSTATVADLLEDKIYSISCIEVDIKGNYQCVEYNTTIHTELSSVTGLVNINATNHNTSHYNQEIQWNNITSTEQVISSYSILYMKNGDENNQTNSEATRSATLILPLPSEPTSYKVWVAAVGSVTGVGEYSQPLIIPLDFPQVPINVEVKNRQCNKLTIIWKEPDNTGGLPMQRYEIATYQPDGSKNKTTSMKTSVSLDFFPNSSQTIQVRTVNSIGTSNFTVNDTFESVPRDPTMILTARAISAMRIKITRKRNTGNEMYQCWINDTQNTNTTISEMSRAFDGLLPDTTYAIDCVEVDSEGKYLCKEYNDSVLTKPGKVEELTFNGLGQVKDNKIHQNISWKRPDSHISKLDYIVTLSYRKESQVSSVNVTASTNFLELELEERLFPIKYMIKVAANSSAGVGEYSAEKTLQYKAPGQPVNVTVTAPSCNMITVAWSPPNNSGGLPITGYSVNYSLSSKMTGNGIRVNSTTFSASIRNVFPGTQYTVSVVAHNLKPGQFSSEMVNMSIRDNTSSIKVSRTSHTTLLLSSASTEADYKCSVSNNMEYDLLSKNSTEVLSLNYDTEYFVDCVEMKDGYAQCTEYNTTILTGLPEVMNLQHPEITVYDSTNIHQTLTWQSLRVTSTQQAVTNYSIRYSHSIQECSLQDGAFKNVTSTTNRTTLVLPVPMSETQYTVCVAAVGNETGTGEYSKLQITYAEPDAPLLRAIDVQSCNKVIVAWDAPQDKGGLPIQGYQLHYYSTSDPTQELVVLNISGNTTEEELDNLLPGTEYTFVIKATTSITTVNNNTLSNTTHFRGLIELLIIPVSAVAMTANITPPIDGADYSCTLSAQGHNPITMNTSTANTTFRNLKPDTNYNVACLVYENGQELCYEGINMGSTFPEVPKEPPTNVIVHDIGSTSFTVAWSVPTGYEYNEDINGYMVVYGTAGSENMINTTVNAAYTATGLTDGSEYFFTVAAITDKGTGVYSAPNITVRTFPIVQNLSSINVTTDSLRIQWDGNYAGYSIHINIDDVNGGKKCSSTIILSGDSKEFNVSSLRPFKEYRIVIYLTNRDESDKGSTVSKTIRTEAKHPTVPPRDTGATTGARNVTLHWKIPQSSGRNGIITSYRIVWKFLGIVQAQTSPITHNLTNPNFTHPKNISYNLSSLTPYTNYQWRVAAVNEKGVGPFSIFHNFTTEEDEPSNVTGIEVQANGSSNTTLLITWQKPTPPNGDITKYKVCYRIEGKSQEQINCRCTELPVEQLQLHTLRPGIPYQVSVQAFTKVGGGNISTHNSAVFIKELKPNRTVGEFSISWMGKNTMNVSWSPLDLHEARGHPVYTVTVKSKSNDREIRKITTNESSVVFNYLSPDLEYIVTVDVTTMAGSARVSKNFGEAKSDVLIIGLVVAVPLALVLCIIGIIVMIIIIARCKRTSKGSYEIREPEVIDLPQIVAAVMDDKLIAYRNIQRKDAISKSNFSEHVRNLHSNKDSRFKSEFEKITKEPAVSNNIAQENRTKNRYVNIFGYDYCRVILNNPDGGDYVNAAYIDGYKKPQKYIATQGPTPSTTMDFWEMIWEQKASVVVMLTRLVEGTKTKCEKYWNEEIDGQYQPGRNLNITTKSYRVMPGFEVRYFEVQKMGDEFGKSSPLKVKQFLYTAWPDHGVPQYSSSMVKFIQEQIRPEVQNSSAPIIVHCSAGAGRTGTLIAIDTTIDRLEEEGDINIFECVELMRARRTQMVQTSSQYIYIHDAINDFVTCGDTAIAAHELGPRTMGLHQVEFGGLHTAFEEQFYTLEGTSPELCKADHDFAELPKVKPRNRYSGLHTYSDNFIETEDEENYVNATEIPGYYRQNHFIAAQAPMKNTVEDTWNVIREQDCKVVVVLTNFNEDGQEMCAPFWPTEAGVPMEVGFMKINLVHTLNYERYDVSEVSLTVQDSDIVTTAKVHHYKAWKKNGRPDVPSLLRLMGDVQRSHQGKKNPLLVMCDDGMSRTGVFITVMSEIDRVKVEGEVDIFHTVKAARKARPHMVSTVFDYELCHEILLNYLESFDTYANFKI